MFNTMQIPSVMISGGGSAPEVLFAVYNTSNEYHKIGIYDFNTMEGKFGTHYYTASTGHDLTGNNIKYKSKDASHYTVQALNGYHLYKFSTGVWNDGIGLVYVGQNASEDVKFAYVEAIYFVVKDPITFTETNAGAF